MEKRISEVIEKMNSVENGIRLRRVHFDIDPNSPGISIDIDKDCRGNYGTAYLLVPPEIVRPFPFKTDDLIELLEFKVSGSGITTDFSCKSLIHEFGHLQDVQTKEFGYTRECNRHLHYYVDVIWNVLLEARLFDTYRMSARCKEDNWRDYYNKLKTPEFSRKREEFEYLWKKRNYCYQEIIDRAQSYQDASQVNHS